MLCSNGSAKGTITRMTLQWAGLDQSFPHWLARKLALQAASGPASLVKTGFYQRSCSHSGRPWSEKTAENMTIESTSILLLLTQYAPVTEKEDIRKTTVWSYARSKSGWNFSEITLHFVLPPERTDVVLSWCYFCMCRKGWNRACKCSVSAASSKSNAANVSARCMMRESRSHQVGKAPRV